VLAKGVNLTAVVRNCQLGGKLINEYDVDEEAFTGMTLISGNFYNYIYGDESDATNFDKYDGCTLLTKAPVVD
jgi:hypothetical protein